MKEFFQQLGCFVIGIAVILLLGMVCLLFLKGGLWLSKTLYPVMYDLSIIAFAVSFLVLLPFSLFKKTRHISINGLIIASFVFGAFTWMCSFIVSYDLWGYTGLFIGIFIGGIGVVPIALLASLFNGQWFTLIHIALLLIITLGFRMLSLLIASKKD